MSNWKIISMEALCELETDCHINGIDLEYEDFGIKYDEDPEHAEKYGCGNMIFEVDKNLKNSAMKKYNITEEEYTKICNELEEALSFGSCGWCV